MSKKAVLMILDGWGIGDKAKDDLTIEMMSIVENAALLGVPFPKRLLAMLEKKEE